MYLCHLPVVDISQKFKHDYVIYLYFGFLWTANGKLVNSFLSQNILQKSKHDNVFIYLFFF